MEFIFRKINLYSVRLIYCTICVIIHHCIHAVEMFPHYLKSCLIDCINWIVVFIWMTDEFLWHFIDWTAINIRRNLSMSFHQNNNIRFYNLMKTWYCILILRNFAMKLVLLLYEIINSREKQHAWVRDLVRSLIWDPSRRNFISELTKQQFQIPLFIGRVCGSIVNDWMMNWFENYLWRRTSDCHSNGRLTKWQTQVRQGIDRSRVLT